MTLLVVKQEKLNIMFTSRTVYFCVLIFFSFYLAIASPPEIGTLSNTKFHTSGETNEVVLSGLKAGTGFDPAITVSGISSNPGVINIINIRNYSQNGFAILTLSLPTVSGTCTLTVTASNNSGTTSKAFTLEANPYLKGRIRLSFSEQFPYSNSYYYDTLISQLTAIKGDTINGFYDLLPRKNELALQKVPPTGTLKGSKYAAIYSGVIIPTLTGIYQFKLSTIHNGEFRISGTGNNGLSLYFDNNNPNITKMADTVFLVSERPYNFSAANYVDYEEDFSVLWGYAGSNPVVTVKTAEELGFINNTTPGYNPVNIGKSISVPGLTLDTLGGEVIAVQRFLASPNTPFSLSLIRKGSNKLQLSWRKSYPSYLDIKYNVYANGELVKKVRNDTTTIISNLLPDTHYAIMICAENYSRVTSNFSPVIMVTTDLQEATPPTAPAIISATKINDVNASFSWSTVVDETSSIWGYSVYLNGNLFKQDLMNPHIDIENLSPATPYSIEVTAVDGNGNVSPKSNPYYFTTAGFNTVTTSAGTYKMEFSVGDDFIGRFEGFGVNGIWEDPTYTTPQALNLMQDLQPSVIRWGSTSTNSFSYASMSGPGGTHAMTYAKFIDFAKQHNAFACIAIGTDSTPTIDWRANPEGTAAKFMAYLTSTVTGTEGDKRKAEGFQESILKGAKGLIIELGHEVWGGANNYSEGINHNADGFNNYLKYRKWARRIARAIKAQPGYDPSKIIISYSGRGPSPLESYGLTETLLEGAKTDPDTVDMIAVGGYLGGYLTYIPIPFEEFYSYRVRELFKYGPQETYSLDLQLNNKQRSMYFYATALFEPHYINRVGQAIFLTDYNFTNISTGLSFSLIDNFLDPSFGVVGSGGEKYIFYDFIKTLNHTSKGQILSTEKKFPNQHFVSYDNKNKYYKAEPVSAHAYYDNGRYSICLINRSFENSALVKVNLPAIGTFNSTGKQYVLSGLSKHSQTLQVDSTIVPISGGMLINIPHTSMIILTFGGPVINKIPLPFGYISHNKPSTFSVTRSNTEENIFPPYTNITYMATVTGGKHPFNKVIWDIKTNDNQEVYHSVYTIAGGSQVLELISPCKVENSIITVTGRVNDNNPNLPVYVNVFTVSGNSNEDCINSLSNTVNEHFKFYPNPSNGLITIEAALAGNMEIRDNMGKTLMIAPLVKGLNKKELNLPAGFYLINFTSGNTSVTKKLIISR